MRRLWIVLLVLLQAATLAAVCALFVEIRRDRGGGDDVSIEDLVEEVSQARFQLQSEGERLRLLIDRWRREGAPAAKRTEDGTEKDPKTPQEIVDRLIEVDDVHARYEYDPLQREPVERERARLEELLRRSGDAAVQAVRDAFPILGDRLRSAHPGWVRTRLLTHVIDPIGTEEARRFAYEVFEDPRYNAGVRLAAARVAMKDGKLKEAVLEELLRLLGEPDPNFNRREQIALFFKQNPDPRAVEPLARIARSLDEDRLLRRMAIEALGSYTQPEAIDALREVAIDTAQADLRGAALHSLNKILGEEILPFLEHLRTLLEPEDPIHQLVDSIEALYRNS